MRNLPTYAMLALFILVSNSACSKRINDQVGLTKGKRGLPDGWVWALGKSFSVPLPEKTKVVVEQPYPHPSRYTDRSDFNASYWNEKGELIVFSVISCRLLEPIDSIQKAISTATELDQGLSDSSPLVKLREKSVTIDRKQGFEFWQRTQTAEENFSEFLDQSPNEEIRKLREAGRPNFDHGALGVKYHACVLLKDDEHIYLLIVKRGLGAEITDASVRPFFDHFKMN